jgi:hypothetical protein
MAVDDMTGWGGEVEFGSYELMFTRKGGRRERLGVQGGGGGGTHGSSSLSRTSSNVDS